MLRRQRILLSPDEAPPAAAVVEKSDAAPEDAQELVKLRRKLADKDNALKERETRIAHLEDENHRLKTPAAPKAPATPAAKSKESVLNEWLY